MKKIEELDNKKFAFKCLDVLKEVNCLNDSTLNILTNTELCKRYFCFSSGFSVLKKVPKNISGDELKEFCSINGRQRYYQDLYFIGTEKYVVVNHWYGPGKSMPDNRTPFYNWVCNMTK